MAYTTRGCCCLLRSWVGMALMGLVIGSLFFYSIYLLLEHGAEATGMVLITGGFFFPFVWVYMDKENVRARLVLLWVTVIGWVILLGSYTFLGWLIIGLTHDGEGKDEMETYYYGGLAVLAIAAIGFIDCARNFYHEKKYEVSGEISALVNEVFD